MTRLAGGQDFANLMTFLRGVRFPAKKDDLVHAARSNGAPNDVVAALEGLPATDFAGQQALADALPKVE